tara:strand:- start:588 stop:722 length:135 start_codon:yes stop_codon:yes gene_type:complete
MQEEIDAYLQSLLDITDNNYAQAAYIVCQEIEVKSNKPTTQYNN